MQKYQQSQLSTEVKRNRSCLFLSFLTLNCPTSIQLSPNPRDPVSLRSRIQLHLKMRKNKKKAFIPASTPLSAKKRRRGGYRKEEERRKTSILPPLSPSLRRRFLVLNLLKAFLSRPSGDPDGRAFQNKKVKIKPSLCTPPVQKHVHDRKAGKIELGWLCRQSERERGASWAQSLCLLFSNRLGRDPGTLAVRQGWRQVVVLILAIKQR